jgi:MATE family multidrug resistance protein
MTASPEDTAAPRRGAQARALLTLGLPLIGSHLAQIAIQITDTVMVGWYDVVSLAALTVAAAVFFVLFLVGSGFAWAVMPMVAAAAGTDDDVQVRRVTRMGLWLSVGFAVAVLPLMVWSEPLLLALGQAPDVARQGALYLGVAGFGLAPALVIMVLKSYLSALERTRIVLVVTIAGAVLNGVLNYALIFGNWGAPELGVRGAAIASLILHVAGAVWLALYAAWKTPEYRLFRNPHRADPEALGRVFRLGWPIGLTNLAEVGLFAAASIMMGWVGTVELAAHGIALEIASVTFMLHLGLSQAVTVRVGQAHGRGDHAEARQLAATGLALSMGVAVATIILFLALPEVLIGLFVAPDDPARPVILATGAAFLAVASVFQLMDGTQVVTLGMLRGVQDTRVPMVIAALAYWAVGVPASYALAFVLGFGGTGLWWGLVIGLALAASLLSARFWGRSARVGPAAISGSAASP